MSVGRAALAGALILAGSCLCSCGTRASERAPDEKAALGGEVAARVGGTAIPLALVQEIAKARQISAHEAVRRAIDDEIAASGARARGLDKQQPASWNLVATRGRMMSDRFLADAKRAGPPTNAEVETLSARHWVEVDRPPTVHVIHALARAKKPSDAPAAQEIAKNLLAAARLATSPEDFEARTKVVAHPKEVELIVERLPAFASDGRVAEGGGAMDVRFAAAAGALAAPGSTSDIVASDFGWHVIRLLERLPAVRMPLEDRRAAFTEEVYAMRSHNAASELLKALITRSPVQVSPAAETLMRSVPIANEQASLP